MYAVGGGVGVCDMDCDYAMHVMPQMTQLHQDVDHVKTKVKQQDQDLKVSSPLVSMCGEYMCILV